MSNSDKIKLEIQAALLKRYQEENNDFIEDQLYAAIETFKIILLMLNDELFKTMFVAIEDLNMVKQNICEIILENAGYFIIKQLSLEED